MNPQSFRANPALWHQSDNLRQMLILLQHLANDGNVTVALLAADFAERTLHRAGGNKDTVTRCVTAVRAWAYNPTGVTLKECKEAAASAYDSDAAIPSSVAANSAADSAAYSAASVFAAHSAADAADFAADACVYFSASESIHKSERQWQLAHVRRKHPLTEL